MEPLKRTVVGGATLRRPLDRDDRGVWHDPAPLPTPRAVDRVNANGLVARLYDPVWRYRSVAFLTRRRYDGTREREAMASWLALGAGEVFLDVGCGSGYALRAVHATCPKAHLHGVDRSEPFLAVAAKRLARDGIEATLVLGDATDLPYDDASVDAVAFAGTPNEVPDRPRALAEVARVLRPGGRLWTMASVRGAGPAARAWARLLAVGGLDLPDADAWTDEILAAGFEAARIEHRPPLTFGRFRRRG